MQRNATKILEKNRTARAAAAACAVVAAVALFWPGRCARGDEGQAYKEQAERLYRTHHEAPDRLPDSIRMYELALKVLPEDYEALWNLAKVCQIYGQSLPQEAKKEKIHLWEKGMAYGERAMAVNPDAKEGHFYYMSNLGSIVQARGKLSSLWNLRRIKRELDRTLELDPDFPPALVARAQYLTRMPGLFGGDPQEAMRLYQRALKVDPGYYIAYYYMAELYAERGQYDLAVESLNKIIHCPEEDRTGSWVTVDLPWSEKLLREVLQKKGNASRGAGTAVS